MYINLRRSVASKIICVNPLIKNINCKILHNDKLEALVHMGRSLQINHA